MNRFSLSTFTENKNMLSVVSIALAGWLSIYTPISIALPTNPTFVGVVTVSNTGPQPKQSDLLKEAFKNVLIKVSGNTKIVDTGPVKGALNHVESYVKMFGYQQSPTGERQLHVQFNERSTTALVRSSGFALSEVAAASLEAPSNPLQDNQANVAANVNVNTPGKIKSNAGYGSAEKPILLWMVVSENNQNKWVDLEKKSEYLDEVDKAAKKYEVSVVLPYFDEKDKAVINSDAVMNNDMNVIKKASERYNSDVLWVGKVTRQQNGWTGKWTIVNKDKIQSWDNTEAFVDTLINGGAQILAAELEKINMNPDNMNTNNNPGNNPYNPQNNTNPQMNSGNPSAYPNPMQNPQNMQNNPVNNSTPNPSNSTNPMNTNTPGSNAPGQPQNRSEQKANRPHVNLTVSGIGGPEQYFKVLEQLGKIPGVTEVEVVEIHPERVFFSLHTAQSKETLAQSIKAISILKENEATQNEKNANQLFYKIK